MTSNYASNEQQDCFWFLQDLWETFDENLIDIFKFKVRIFFNI